MELRLMLLPFVADVKATVFVGCNIISGRWYSTIHYTKTSSEPLKRLFTSG